MRELLLIGVWKNYKNPQYPSANYFIDFSWDANIKRQVIWYLKRIQPYVVSPGRDECVIDFNCQYTSLGMCMDERYNWPLNLVHYVECHGVRLPDEFVEHVTKNIQSAIKIKNQEIDYKNVIVRDDWWLNQKGWLKDN